MTPEERLIADVRRIIAEHRDTLAELGLLDELEESLADRQALGLREEYRDYDPTIARVPL